VAFNIRIRLKSTNVEDIEKVTQQIIEIARKTGAPYKGPVRLPTRKMKVPIFRLPHGEGSKYWDHYELRVHRRMIDLVADERVLRRLMRIQIPESVKIVIQQRRG